MTSLVVETGTNIPNANTYVDADYVRAYAKLRNISLPVATSDYDPIEAYIVLATDYLESLKYIGMRSFEDQSLSWPRRSSDGSSCIPDAIKKAQAQLVIEQAVNEIDLQPSQAGGTQFITKERVDVIETCYSEKLGTLSTPYMTKVDSLLRAYVVNGSGRIMAVRV